MKWIQELQHSDLKSGTYGIFDNDVKIMSLTRLRMPNEGNSGLPYANFQLPGGSMTLSQLKEEYPGCVLVPISDITYICEI